MRQLVRSGITNRTLAGGRFARRVRGMFLLEALVALVVFSIAMLGLVGLFANALGQSGNAHWRSEAFGLASSTLSRMWAENVTALASRYDAAGDGAGYRALLAASLRLPGVSASVNAPRVTFEDVPIDRRRVSVTVYWQSPAGREAHQASVTGVLPRD